MEDFGTSVRLARAGSAEGARELVEKYGDRVHRALRRVLNGSQRLRLQCDSLDIALFAWDVLFRRLSAWDEIETPDQLIAVLLTIGTNHIRDMRRRFDRERCGRRLVSLEDGEAQAAPDRDVSSHDLIAFRDRLEAVLRGRPQLHAWIVELRGSGHTCDEIAGVVGRSVRQVRRVLADIEAELTG